MVIYVPGTEETDPKKQNMSLQQLGAAASDLQDASATYVVGPASATNNGFAVYDGITGKLIKNHAATVALGSEVSGTLPVANGGTGDTGGVWATYSLSPVFGGAGAGTLAGSYLQIGKLLFMNASVTITSTGTTLNIPIPNFLTPTNTGAIIGLEGNVTNRTLNGILVPAANNFRVLDTTISGNYVPTNGHIVYMTGCFQVA